MSETAVSILLNNAISYIKDRRFDNAKELLCKAQALSPNHPEVLRYLSIVAAMTFDYIRALELIDRVILLTPDHGIAHSNRGNILKELNRLEDALLSLDKAIDLQPNYVEAYLNKGNVLQSLFRYEESLIWYDKAIEMLPRYADAHSNKGNALALLGRHDEALYHYDVATEINPNFTDAYWHKAMTQLSNGDYELGWKNYEARWFKSHSIQFQYSHIKRLESLQNIAGKKILIWSEQGLGDTIQFCRYIEPLADLGATIIFSVQRPLMNVLSSMGNYCCLVCGSDEPMANIDFQSPLLSLPLLFSTAVDSIPGHIPYLACDFDKKIQFESRLKKNKNLKVGVVWNGGFRKDSPELWSINARRNIDLGLIANLKDVPLVDFYSLQKGDPAESELLALQATVWPNIINCATWLEDFSDTAGLIENLDLIISVDTSTAHLAGALGKPVWILNRYDSCWRWLHGRSDSPWYPSAKIYQQLIPGDWEKVVERVKADLRILALAHLNQ